MPTSSGNAAVRVAAVPMAETLDVLGLTIEFQSEPAGADDAFCVMQWTIPPGAVVPLHSHPDPETCLLVSGTLEGFARSEGSRWLRIIVGDVLHVPPGTRRAFRNRSPEPAVMIVASTARVGRFFQEVGRSIAAGEPAQAAPSRDRIGNVRATARRYGYRMASAAENAAIGLSLSGIR